MRLRRWAAACAAAIVVCGGAPALAAPAHPRLTHISADATPLTVYVGHRTSLTGAVTPGVAAETVTLQRLVAGRWQLLGHTKTAKLGRYAFSVPAAKKPGSQVLRVTGTGARSKSLTLRTTKAVFKVRAAAASSVVVGNPLVVTGTTTPVVAGPAQLQVLSHGVWTKIASVGLTRQGAFTLYGFQPLGSHRLRVIRPYTKTVAGGVSRSFVVTVVSPPQSPPPPAAAGSVLSIPGTDSVALGMATPRLAFSGTVGLPLPAARSLTVSNPGTDALTIGAFALIGTQAGNFALAPGQPTTLTVAPGASATVSVVYTPASPTGCPSAASPAAVGSVNSAATLTFASSDPDQPNAYVSLTGIYSCSTAPYGEPVLDQQLQGLGYTTNVDAPGADRRTLGPLRVLGGTDEIAAPYFTAADPDRTVTLVPLAHYDAAHTVAYQATGWYAQGATLGAGSVCSVECRLLWQFPADPSSTMFAENQKLLPAPVGTTSFNPVGRFGLYSGDGPDVAFSDDGLNIAHQPGGSAVPVAHYLHEMRVFPAYGPRRVLIPNTYLVAVDNGRVPGVKTNDYQDLVLLLTNATPAVTPGPTPGPATTSDLTVGGTISDTCYVTGFDGVLPNDTDDQCDTSHIASTPAGLALRSSSGQLANNNQQNALYKTFDATQGAFTVTARVVGPINQLTTNYQQIGAFFGADQNNFVKVEAEHHGSGAPHLTMFYREGGAAGVTVSTVTVPALTSASTLDLILRGNASVPDPVAAGDTYGVHGYPLDEVTVYYSLNGTAPVQVGTIKSPADLSTWFSPQAKAGVEVSNTGTTTKLTATFSRFAITAG